jgi:NAD(P)-dependent dehydrogenase (short-subunit alcohol dehydrogenase family)
MRLKDKVTAITGAGRKICRAAAELFARVARFPASDEA